jgi:hypothetical protein
MKLSIPKNYNDKTPSNQPESMNTTTNFSLSHSPPRNFLARDRAYGRGPQRNLSPSGILFRVPLVASRSDRLHRLYLLHWLLLPWLPSWHWLVDRWADGDVADGVVVAVFLGGFGGSTAHGCLLGMGAWRGGEDLGVNLLTAIVGGKLGGLVGYRKRLLVLGKSCLDKVKLQEGLLCAELESKTIPTMGFAEGV